MKMLEEYAKYINEQCDKICGFFVDEYGESMEAHNDDIYISIFSKIRAHNDSNFCTCEVEHIADFYAPVYGYEAHKRLQGMERFIFNELDTQIILRDVEHKGKELAKRLMQEAFNIDIQFYGISSMHTCRMT